MYCQAIKQNSVKDHLGCAAKVTPALSIITVEIKGVVQENLNIGMTNNYIFTILEK